MVSTHLTNQGQVVFFKSNKSPKNLGLGFSPSQDAGSWQMKVCLLGFPILKMVHNPGGDDCILGGGDNPTCILLGSIESIPYVFQESNHWDACELQRIGFLKTAVLRCFVLHGENSKVVSVHPNVQLILLMAEILHQFIGSFSHYLLSGFIHPRWCKISAINSIIRLFFVVCLPNCDARKQSIKHAASISLKNSSKTFQKTKHPFIIHPFKIQNLRSKFIKHPLLSKNTYQTTTFSTSLLGSMDCCTQGL